MSQYFQQPLSHIKGRPAVPAKVRRLVEKINRRWPPRCISCQRPLHPELALTSELGARYCEGCFPKGTVEERCRAAEGPL